ncbi:MAG: 5'-nucleotidase C-terminal domain-containing protein [Acidobacteriota bacterium]
MTLKKLPILLGFLLIFQIIVVAQKADSKTSITILQLNDVYQIAPVDRGRRGGMARVAGLQKEIRAKSPNTLFLLAGDFISPSVASRLFKGKQMIAALNAAEVDIATLGNHEFDFGPDVLLERMRESRFAYTVANVIDKKTGKPFGGASPYIAKNFNGVRVAIFGLLVKETESLSSPGKGVLFKDPIATGKRLARQLRIKGFDVIIALTHLPMADDKRLAAECDVDLIIGGHEHELLESMAGCAPIMKMGSDARNLGRIQINVERKRNSRTRYRVASIDWEAIPVTEQIKDDPDAAAAIAVYEKQLNESLGEVLGKTDVILEARAGIIRRNESNLGNYIADVYRSALSADVAIVNSGSIRSDATYGIGELTKKDVLSILPFENGLVKVRLTGEHLKRLLENGVSKAGEEDGRFPQVSGMSFTYDGGKPVGSRIVSIEINGKAYDPAQKYTMVVSAYSFGGGDGYDFKGAEVLVKPTEGPIEPELMMDAIKKAGTIAPKIEGRIKSVQPH